MKKKHLQSITALVCGVLSILLLVSCANVEMPAPQVSQEKGESQIIEEILEQLPSVEESEAEEIVGQPLLLLTPDETLVYGDEDTAGSVSAACLQRNQLIEEAYQMELKAVLMAEADIAECLRMSLVSGAGAGDLLCYSAKTTASLWNNGLLKDLAALPYFDTNISCYDTVAAGSLSYGSSLYALPDPSAQSADETYVLFYDRALVQGAGLVRPETLVNAGEWTHAQFQKYAEKVAESVMGRESYDLATDIFGYGSHDNASFLPYVLWCSTGNGLFSAGETGELTYAYDAETLTDLLTPLQALYDSRCRLPLEGEEAYTAFREGRLGFLVAKLGYLKELYANGEREYGVLPLPKEEGDSRYHCPVDVSGMLFSVPVANLSDGKSGLALNALCAIGGLLVRNAEKETYLTMYAKDNDQSCMLETVLDSGIFDFGTVFGECDSSVKELSTKLVAHALVDHSRVSSLLKTYLDDLEEWVEEMREILPSPEEAGL